MFGYLIGYGKKLKLLCKARTDWLDQYIFDNIALCGIWGPLDQPLEIEK